jgi:hypothetical protein
VEEWEEEFKHLNLIDMFKHSKRGQTGGLITGLVFGVVSLVIGVIIAFVIVSTLTGADLLTDGRTSSSVTGETGGFINTTGYQLDGLDVNYVPGTITIDGALNTTSGQMLLSGNYSVSSTGLVNNASVTTWEKITFNYTSLIYSTEELSSSGLSGNFTAGVDNVSSKIPTVLLVAAIVLILGVLVLLVVTWQRMNIGGGI